MRVSARSAHPNPPYLNIYLTLPSLQIRKLTAAVLALDQAVDESLPFGAAWAHIQNVGT